MSTLDMIIYLIMSLLIGYVTGFLTVKINHALVILFGRLWSSGNAQRRYILVGAIVIIVFGIISFNQTNFILAVVFTSAFAVLFVVGIKHAMYRFHQYEPILKASIQSLFPKEDSDTDDNYNDLLDDALKISLEMLKSMRKSQLESLKILFVFFDSIFGGFLIFLLSGKIQEFKFRRFIYLSKEDQVAYMHVFADSSIGNLMSTALKAFIGYNYYTSHFSWDKIGYNGAVLRRSFIN
ncbi:MAG: hypothetical protein O6761_02600 [Thaumarchaeota archaeon]|nr:hypothetical protein [Nitrososphaerota archaeon]